MPLAWLREYIVAGLYRSVVASTALRPIIFFVSRAHGAVIAAAVSLCGRDVFLFLFRFVHVSEISLPPCGTLVSLVRY